MRFDLLKNLDVYLDESYDVFALIFCSMFYWLMSKKKETVVTVAAK